MEYLRSLIFKDGGNKRKHEEITASKEEYQPAQKKLRASQSQQGGYKYQTELLGAEEVKEGHGLLARGIRDGGRRAIRVEALAFATPHNQFQTFRLDLITESNELNMEADRDDLEMFRDVLRASLQDEGKPRRSKGMTFTFDQTNGLFKAKRKAGQNGTRSLLLKNSSSTTEKFDFVVTHVCPYKFSIQSHVKHLDRVDVAGWLKCIENLFAAMERISFPREEYNRSYIPASPGKVVDKTKNQKKGALALRKGPTDSNGRLKKLANLALAHSKTKKDEMTIPSQKRATKRKSTNKEIFEFTSSSEEEDSDDDGDSSENEDGRSDDDNESDDDCSSGGDDEDDDEDSDDGKEMDNDEDHDASDGEKKDDALPTLPTCHTDSVAATGLEKEPCSHSEHKPVNVADDIQRECGCGEERPMRKELPSLHLRMTRGKITGIPQVDTVCLAKEMSEGEKMQH